MPMDRWDRQDVCEDWAGHVKTGRIYAKTGRTYAKTGTVEQATTCLDDQERQDICKDQQDKCENRYHKQDHVKMTRSDRTFVQTGSKRVKSDFLY